MLRSAEPPRSCVDAASSYWPRPGRLLLAEGMAGFTIERVAALAGASKMTIYKWWPSKGALALDGYSSTVEAVLAFPDTGDIEADLTAQLTAFVRLVRDTPAGRVIAELIGQAQTDPELAAAYRATYSGPRRALAMEALTRAQGRGQLRADVDPEVVVDQLWGGVLPPAAAARPAAVGGLRRRPRAQPGARPALTRRPAAARRAPHRPTRTAAPVRAASATATASRCVRRASATSTRPAGAGRPASTSTKARSTA